MREKLAGRMNPEIRAVEPMSCPTLTKGDYRYDYGDASGMSLRPETDEWMSRTRGTRLDENTRYPRSNVAVGCEWFYADRRLCTGFLTNDVSEKGEGRPCLWQIVPQARFHTA